MVYAIARDIHLRFPVIVNNKTLRKELTAKIGRLFNAKPTTVNESVVVVEALRAINFEISEGERIGLIGHNGAGKSSILKLLAGIYEPTSGKLSIEGKTECLIDIGFGIEPEVSGYENIRFVLELMGETGKKLESLVTEIAEFTELGDRLFLPVSTYSAGMATRLSFSISTAMSPEILLIDEVIGTGDANFYKKAKARVEKLRDTTKILFLATHSDELIREWCTRVIWLEQGSIKMDGDTESVLNAYSNSLS